VLDLIPPEGSFFSGLSGSAKGCEEKKRNRNIQQRQAARGSSCNIFPAVIVAPWGNGPAGGTSARFDNDGADSIQTTCSSKNCRDLNGLVFESTGGIPEKKSDMIFRFADHIDRLSGRIKKTIGRLDQGMTLLERRRCS
jgi:hypothetical protein